MRFATKPRDGARRGPSIADTMTGKLILAMLVCQRAAALYDTHMLHRAQQMPLSNLQLLVPLTEGEAGLMGGEAAGGWWPQAGGPFYGTNIMNSGSEEEAEGQEVGPSLQDLVFLAKHGPYSSSADSNEGLTFYNPPEKEASVPQQAFEQPRENSAEIEYLLGHLPLYQLTYDAPKREVSAMMYTAQDEAEEEEDGSYVVQRYNRPLKDESLEAGSVGRLCAQLVQGGQGLGMLGLRLIRFLCQEHLQREAECRGQVCEDSTCGHQLLADYQVPVDSRPLSAPRPVTHPRPRGLLRPRTPSPPTWYSPSSGRRYWNVISEEYPGQMKQYVGIVNRQQ